MRRQGRLNSCMGRFSAVWLTTCPVTRALKLSNEQMQCAVRRRLGLAVKFEGADRHGHHSLADNTGGRLNARHTGMLAAWKQVLVEAGGRVPDRNEERLLSSTHVLVPSDDQRRMDLVATGLNVYDGLPIFCDATILSPISRNGNARPGTSNAGGVVY